MLCQLSYNHHVRFVSKAGAKVLHFFDMTKFFRQKNAIYLILLHFSIYFLSLAATKMLHLLHFLHHLAGLLKLLEEAVYLHNAGARAFGNTILAATVE